MKRVLLLLSLLAASCTTNKRTYVFEKSVDMGGPRFTASVDFTYNGTTTTYTGQYLFVHQPKATPGLDYWGVGGTCYADACDVDDEVWAHDSIFTLDISDAYTGTLDPTGGNIELVETVYARSATAAPTVQKASFYIYDVSALPDTPAFAPVQQFNSPHDMLAKLHPEIYADLLTP